MRQKRRLMTCAVCWSGLSKLHSMVQASPGPVNRTNG